MGVAFKLHSLLALALHAGSVLADYQVGTYPAPTDLTSSKSHLITTFKSLTTTLNNSAHGSNYSTVEQGAPGLGNITFSVGLFSLHDPNAVHLQYHHTSPETQKAQYGGTHKVDANSIYRIASVSKLITVLAGMVELTEKEWSTPVSTIIPGLVKNSSKRASAASDPTSAVQWDKVTLWSLASQLSGIPTLGIAIGDLYFSGTPKKYGAPQVNITAFSPCVAAYLKNPNNQDCPASEEITTVAGLPPNFEPWSTPAYSDLNFMILGEAISKLRGKSMTNVYNSSILHPLNMTSTFDFHPTDKTNLARSVIAGDPKGGFAIEAAFTTPSGGLFSTISDLQKLGVGILSNKLLSAEVTRKWMKPVSHTASLSYSIGAPWEIHRFVHPKTGKVTDLYTKLGDSGSYGGAMVLIPEYDAGFTMLNAGTDLQRSSKALALLDAVTSVVVPALEAQAAQEAEAAFVGTYKSTDTKIPASLTISRNASTVPDVHSDLIVSKWTYNRTDVLAGPFFLGIEPRLEQSIPNAAAGTGKPGKVAFQLSSNAQTTTYMEAVKVFAKSKTPVVGTWTGFYTSNSDFSYTDKERWAGYPITELVFDVDGKGKVTGCSPLGQRITLKKE